MSESNGKAKANLYDLDISEISMTDESQGFAASGMETILLKNRYTCKEDLTEEQTALLEKYGEEFTPLYKQGGDAQSLSSVKSDAGEDENLTKGNEMSDQETSALQKAQDEIATLKKALVSKELGAELSKFNLSNVDKVVDAMQGVSAEERTELTKAFEELYTTKVDVEKAAKQDQEIDKELGYEGQPEQDVEKSLNEKIAEKVAKLQEGA